LLFLGRKSLAFVEDNQLLAGVSFSLFRLRNGRDELGAATGFNRVLGGLTLRVEFPVPLRWFIRRVENRVFVVDPDSWTTGGVSFSGTLWA